MRTVPLFVLAGLLTACGSGEEQRDRPPPLVKVGAVATHDFADRYEAIGTATANEQVVLTAPVTERIVRLGFDDGQFVRKGQLIAELALGQENAALAGANARAREADQQLVRIKALRDKGFATKASFDAQVAAAAAARADAAEARASIGDRFVVAPFSGYVSLRQVSVGAVASAGTPIATISDTSTIKLDFTVPETMTASVAVGQPIAARSAAFPDAVFRGTIRAIDPVLDPATRAIKLRALIPNGDARIKPGMLMTVDLESRPRRAPGVPELAILNEGEARFVFVLGKDGKVKRARVTTGGRLGNLVEIANGLAPGTRIVTEGVVKLSDGIKVRTGNDRRLGGGPKGAPAR
jgi:membrane fusion protein (multidrug efflux system)